MEDTYHFTKEDNLFFAKRKLVVNKEMIDYVKESLQFR